MAGAVSFTDPLVCLISMSTILKGSGKRALTTFQQVLYQYRSTDITGLQLLCLLSANQFELHPFLDREEVIAYCQREGIVVESYSPITKGKKLDDPTVVEIAKK